MSAQGNNEKTLLDVLLAKGVLTKSQADRVRLENINTGRPQEEILLEHNFVQDGQLAQAKGEIYKIPYVDLSQASISPEALNLLPEPVARRYVVFPLSLGKEKNTLSLAMGNPLDLSTIDFIEQKTGKKVIPFIAPLSEINQAIEEKYAQSLSEEVTAALKETAAMAPKEEAVDLERIGKVISIAPVAKIVATLLEFAIKSRASDIHIEPQEGNTKVRYRIDGILHEKLILPRNVHDAVVSRVKILSGMKIDEKRLPQDGRFNFKVGEEEVDLRVSCLPSSHGEKIVMRLLKKTGKVPTLLDLGLRGRALKNLQDSILIPHGIILVTGPTGSGKTTTLYAVLSQINTPRVNIITLEDPIEYGIPGITQVQVNPIAGLTFASGLRSFLRQDPNIIMVGEIRDEETAELAIQAALTGHLVFSTLHTNSAAGALPRLLDMKAEPFLLASSMTSIVAQRVVRRICKDCFEEYTPLPAIIEDIKKALGNLFVHEQDFKLARGKGCDKCNQTGYSGRIGIFEVLPVSEKIGRLILERAPATKIEETAVEEGMITMKQDGYLKAVEKITSIEEVLRVAQT